MNDISRYDFRKGNFTPAFSLPCPRSWGVDHAFQLFSCAASSVFLEKAEKAADEDHHCYDDDGFKIFSPGAAKKTSIPYEIMTIASRININGLRKDLIS